MTNPSISVDLNVFQNEKIMENERSTEAAVVMCGPWGGGGGNSFYDGRGDIVEIHVTYGANHIKGIQTSYIREMASFKQAFKASPHGVCTGGYTSQVRALVRSISVSVIILFPP